MAAKQEVITEAAEGVVPVSNRARAPSAGVALQNPPPRMSRMSPWSPRPRSGLARWKFSMSEGSRMSRAATHDLSSGPYPSQSSRYWSWPPRCLICWWSIYIQQWLLALSIGVSIQVDQFEERDMEGGRDPVISRKFKLVRDLIYLFNYFKWANIPGAELPAQ